MSEFSQQADPTVREFGSTRLALRGDLIFTPQTADGQSFYMIEDPLNSRFFRLGRTEYTFVSLLDGRTTIHQALSHLSSVLPHHRMTEHDAAGLCRWLVESDLAHTEQSAQAARLANSAQKVEQRKAMANINPLVFRVPLMAPDRAFKSMEGYIGWLYSKPVAVVWAILLVVGGYFVVSDWNRFSASSQGIFSADNWVSLFLCWLLLKIVHEISHGVVCSRYGGTVRETGILFILFAPLAFVDVTSSWRFRSRRQRMHVAAAGMYIELAIAAIAAIVWSQSTDGWLCNLCYNTIIMASITTLVFNANPLMKFDGYYILSDALGMPNLYINGTTYIKHIGRRYFLGLPSTLPDWSRGHRIFIRCYGCFSFAWRMMICVTMTITAVTLFHGAGIVLAALGFVMWIGMPTAKFVYYLIAGKTGERPKRVRFFLLSGTLTAAAIGFFGFVPWPGARLAPAVVEFSPNTIVRSGCSGFIREIHVQSGELVEEGQLLVTMENRKLVRDVADLKLQIEQSEIKSRRHEQKGERAEQQSEAEQRESLRKQLAEREEQVEMLLVRAPHNGTIVRRDLNLLLDTYLKEGDDIVSLGDQNKKELRLSVSQDDLEVFTARVGHPIRIDIPRQPSWYSDLEKVIPRASLQPEHPAMTTVNGGPIAVKPVEGDSGETEAFEFLAPRFTAIVALTPRMSRNLHAGQVGRGVYRPFTDSIFEHIYNTASRWIREQLTKQS